MILPLEAPLAPGRTQSARGPVNIVPDLRSYRYEPKPCRLSPMQMLVTQLVCCGLADKEIAFILGVSSATVKAHMSRAIKDMVGMPVLAVNVHVEDVESAPVGE